MAGSTEKRKVSYSVFIDGGAAEKTLRQLYQDKRKINNELKDMKIGSDEYIKATKKYKDIDGQLKEHRKNINGVKESQKDLVAQSGLFNRELALMQGAFGKAKAAGMLLVGMFRTLSGAIALTGIGALVIAITSLVAYFTKTKRGAELLDRVMAALGATVAVITDRFSAMGDGIIEAVTNPKKAIMEFGDMIKDFVIGRFELVMKSIDGFGTALDLIFEGKFKDAATAAGEAFIELQRGINPAAMLIEGLVNTTNALIESTASVVDEITREAEAAYNLEMAMQRLIDRERELRVEEAQTRKDIRAKRLLVEDDTLSYEKRLQALSAAADMEKQLNAEQLAAARERVSIIEQQVALGESMAEDYDRLADAQVALANIEANSLKLQKTLAAEYNTLLTERESKMNKEIALRDAEREKRVAIEQELYEAGLAQTELEIVNLMKAYETKVSLAEKYGLDVSNLTEKLERDINGINAKYRAADLKAQEATANREMQLLRQKQAQQRAIANSGADILSSLSDFVGADTVAGAKLARNSALLQIGVDTAQAISAAVKSSSQNPANAVTFGGAGAAQFIAMSASILANIAKAKTLLSEPLPTYTATPAPTFATGGYTGLGFGAPDHTGKTPVGIVHANEWVAPDWMVSNPRTANTIAWLEATRKQGQTFAEGGFTTTSTAPSDTSQQMQQLTNVLSGLTMVLNNGIEARYTDREVRNISEVQAELNAIETEFTIGT